MAGEGDRGEQGEEGEGERGGPAPCSSAPRCPGTGRSPSPARWGSRCPSRGVISGCHVRKAATEYDRKPGIKWPSCNAKWQSDILATLPSGRPPPACSRAAARPAARHAGAPRCATCTPRRRAAAGRPGRVPARSSLRRPSSAPRPRCGAHPSLGGCLKIELKHRYSIGSIDLQLHPTSLGYVTIRYYPTCTVPDPVPEGAGATHLVGARALGDAAGVHEDLHGRRGALGPAPRGKGLAQGSKLRFAVGGFAGGAQGPAAMMPPPPPRTPVSPTWVPLFSVAAPKGLRSLMEVAA